MKKRVLIISECPMRGESIGLIGKFLDSFVGIDKTELFLCLFDTGFFDCAHDPKNYKVDSYYALPKKNIESCIRKIPFVRSKYAEKLIISTYAKIINDIPFDLIVVYQIPLYAKDVVLLAHKRGIKVAFYPWGSDILRITPRKQKKIQEAFSFADYVIGAENSNTIIAAKEKYKVPNHKFVLKKNYISGVKVLIDVMDKYTRSEMMEKIGIPYSDYNIICGYNGSKMQRHKDIIEAISQNKSVLPNNYQLVFLMSYGSCSDYELELKQMCDENSLNSIFITSFLSNEQIAFLHLITDLMIEIQPTDTGNAFIIESIFAKNTIITGRWLQYQQFEQYGEPYYLIDSINDLPKILNNLFLNKLKKIHIPEELIHLYTIPQNYDKCDFWRDFLKII